MNASTSSVSKYDETIGMMRGFVIEQTLTGYGIAEYRKPYGDGPWQFAGFEDGFDSSADCRAEIIARGFPIRGGLPA